MSKVDQAEWTNTGIPTVCVQKAIGYAFLAPSWDNYRGAFVRIILTTYTSKGTKEVLGRGEDPDRVGKSCEAKRAL